jgi:chromosome partitioning protein
VQDDADLADADEVDEAPEGEAAVDASDDVLAPAIDAPTAGVLEPSVAEPAPSEPQVSAPNPSEPSVAEPSVAQPSVAEPSVPAPGVPEPGAGPGGPVTGAATEDLPAEDPIPEPTVAGDTIIVIPPEPDEDEDEVDPDRGAALPGPTPGPLPGLVGLPELEDPQHEDQPPEAQPAEVEADSAPPSPFARPLPRVMAIANQKGGVGKTTTAVNLGACLADLGYRVLVVDLDPQGNASTGMGVNIRDLQGSMYDVILHELPIEDCVEATSVRNLFCAPSSLELAGADVELVPAFSRELRLKRALDEVKEDYDFVLIDCPPSLGLLTVNAFAAASEVVVPIQCEYYALEGLGQLLRNVNLVQKNLNPTLELSALILVMYDARTKLADQVVSEVREHFGEKVCRQVVPRTVRLSEAPSFGQPIIAFDPSSRGAIAYRELAKEVSGGTPQRTG